MSYLGLPADAYVECCHVAVFMWGEPAARAGSTPAEAVDASTREEEDGPKES